MSNPKLLNLDELELVESDITIRFQGKDHKMAVLTVEAYLKQQRRAREQLELEERVALEGVTDTDTEAMVMLLRNAIADFFPTLPVDQMETQRLFQIFGWMNELAAQINEAEGADVAAEVSETSAEGNAPAETPES
jgi:hypothetical protein